MVITPTVGRIVWFYSPSANSAFASATGPKPHAAVVVHVYGDRLVNLSVFDACGVPRGYLSVPLIQDGETPPADHPYCCWMPYQIGQAKKQAADEKPVATTPP